MGLGASIIWAKDSLWAPNQATSHGAFLTYALYGSLPSSLLSPGGGLIFCECRGLVCPPDHCAPPGLYTRRAQNKPFHITAIEWLDEKACIPFFYSTLLYNLKRKLIEVLSDNIWN